MHWFSSDIGSVAMSDSTDEFGQRYRRALEARIAGNAEEGELVDALGLGRAALSEGRGLLDLLSLHQSLVQSLIAGLVSTEITNIVGKSHEFLSEVVAPFEMTQRGWHDVVARLQQLNETLERRVTERTQALSKSEEQLRRAQRLAQMGSDVRDLRTDETEWSDESYRNLWSATRNLYSFNGEFPGDGSSGRSRDRARYTRPDQAGRMPSAVRVSDYSAGRRGAADLPRERAPPQLDR